MHPVAEKLLEQHIAFELEALTGKGLQGYLRDEVRRAFELAEDLSLREYATEKRCLAAFKRLLVKAKIPRSAEAFVISLILCVAQRLQEKPVALKAVISREQFLELAELIGNLQSYRSRLIADLFNHPLYADLLSRLVYQALVTYLIEDNLISQRVPGVGSMLKLGRKVANRAVPDLDSKLEQQLQHYIQTYLPTLIDASEQFIETALSDPAFLKSLADAWPEIGSQSLSSVLEELEETDIQGFGDWGARYWDSLRHSDYFVDLGETVIAKVFESYGDRPMAALLRDLGITRTMVSSELIAFAPPLMKRLRDAGYLEAFLRGRLEPFYASRAVQGILRAGMEAP